MVNSGPRVAASGQSSPNGGDWDCWNCSHETSCLIIAALPSSEVSGPSYCCISKCIVNIYNNVTSFISAVLSYKSLKSGSNE